MSRFDPSQDSQPVIGIGTWSAKKLDGVIDTALKTGTVALIAAYSDPLRNVFETVFRWLMIAARQIF
jgi:hypothetical protein